MSTATGGGKKRKSYHHSRNRKNPERGSPGILLTCETGREFKCRREGLEILDYYWNRLHHDSHCDDDVKEAPKQSLEEELTSLKKKAGTNETPFVEMDTGCRGTVLFLTKDAFETPNEQTKQSPEIKSAPDSEADPVNEESADSSPSKKLRLDDTTARPPNTLETSSAARQKSATWDPLELVQSIFQDIINPPKGDYTIPGSRFVTRVIPMQATCFASPNDLKTTMRNLLVSHFDSLSDNNKQSKKDGVTTFAIHSKRRNCGHLTREDIIQAVGEQVDETTRELDIAEWKVDLKKPDYTIWVEVCVSLCGVSIIPSKCLAMAPNFNMAERALCAANKSHKNDDP